MLAFIRNHLKRVALCRAIAERNLLQVQELIGRGLDLNFVVKGSSPLCRAVWRLEDWKTPDRRIVDFLLTHGASAGKPGNDSLLVGAARIGDHGLIDLALDAGHDIHFRPRHTPTPLQVAAFRNKPDTMRYLIAKGASKEDFDVEKCSWTSINPETISVLLELGVKVPDDVVECVREGIDPK